MFEDWLSAKSNLNVTFIASKPQAITTAWLASFDVILLQDLRTWTFTADEVSAFGAWIQGGGGLIALSGYDTTDPSELVPTNQLLKATGLALLPTEVPGQTCDVTNSNALCPNSKVSATPKCYCWGNTLPVSEWTQGTPVATDLIAIGAFRGRGVSAGMSGSVVASYRGAPIAASASLGFGKVLLFGDEVVTYVNQWVTGGMVTSNTYDPCWHEIKGSACFPGAVFQYKQFWYNAIKFVAPPSACTFVIDEPEVVLVQ